MSSFFDDASLVQIPSGYKVGTLFSIKPTDGTGDLTFTRSNDTATRVGPDGLIEKVRTNLLLQSNTFDTTWTTSGVTLTSGQSGYSGGNNAWLLSKTSGPYVNIAQSVSVSDVWTFSVYAKANTLDSITLRNQTNGNDCDFNLTSATTARDGAIASSITLISNDWYRCSATFIGASTQVAIYLGFGSGAAGSVYIQDAQLETGDIATDYIATTTAAVSVGPVANLPRLDYSGGATCPKLLLEPQRTNLITQSEYFSDSDWDKIAIVVDSNEIISPDGTQNADKLTKSASNALIRQFISTSGENTFSVYIKKGSLSWVRLYIASSTESAECWFDLENGLTGNTSGNPDSVEIIDVNNGWYRCVITKNTTNINNFRIYPSQADDDTSGTSGYIYAWGAQVEAGSYATSYINTLNSAVTRGADSCSKTGISSLIGQTEGTLCGEFTYSRDDGGLRRLLSLTDGGTTNRITTYVDNNDKISLYIVNSSSEQVDIRALALVVGTTYKYAIAYKLNDVKVYVNGVEYGSDTSATIPSCSQLYVGSENGNSPSYFNWNQVLLFPTRLTNAQLAELTA